MKNKTLLVSLVLVLIIIVFLPLNYFYRKTTIFKKNLRDNFILNFHNYNGDGTSYFWEGFDGIYFSTWGGFVDSWPIVIAGVEKIKGVDRKSFEVLGIDYAKDKDHVFYKTKIISGADPETFEPVLDGDVKFLGESVMSYAKDNSHVYLAGSKYENIDPQSFEPISMCFIKDKNGVYFQCNKDNNSRRIITTETKKIDNIDTGTFNRIEYIFYMDKNIFYSESMDGSKPYLKALSDEDAKKMLSEWHIKYDPNIFNRP